MTAEEEIRDHQQRCQPYLLRLQTLTLGEDGPPPSAAEVGQVTDTIIAEAAAASRAALAASGESRRHPGAPAFLQVRLNRLTAAADEAVCAARDGNFVWLRRLLRRFEALTSAIWTVQRAVCGTAVSARLPSGRSAAARRSMTH